MFLVKDKPLEKKKQALSSFLNKAKVVKNLVRGMNSKVWNVLFLILKEDVDSFMKQPGNETADIVLKKLDEQYQKYKFMELNLAQKKRR